MFFDTFGVEIFQIAPKVPLNDRFYKVFLSTFPVASKRCFTKGFLMFGNIAKRIQLSLKNLMLFDTFRVHFAKRAPKVSLNDRFYKVLRLRISQVRFIYKPNAFLMILVTLFESGCHFGPFMDPGKDFSGFWIREKIL